MRVAPLTIACSAFLDAVDKGGLFIVGQDIYPTQAIEAAHVVFPVATQFELNMTSINGGEDATLSEVHGSARRSEAPIREIMALDSNGLKRSSGRRKQELADRFSGYDWKTDADVFADAAQAAAAGGRAKPFRRYQKIRKHL